MLGAAQHQRKTLPRVRLLACLQWGLQDHLSARLVCPLAAASSRSPARAGRQDLEENSSIIKVTGTVETKGWVAAAAALVALL